MSSKRSPGGKGKVLQGHKRVGKRIVPPMMQFRNLQQISFVKSMLPELIWIGLINHQVDYIPAARIFEKLVEACPRPEDDTRPFNHAVASCYSKLTPEERHALTEKLAEADLLNEIRELIAPITVLFDESPLHFLGKPNKVRDKKPLIDLLDECVESCMDKFATPGIMLHGAMFLARLKAGTISFPREMQLPDFDSVIFLPDSQEASRAAGFLRANALGEFGMLEIGHEWASTFWNGAYSFQKCEEMRQSDD